MTTKKKDDIYYHNCGELCWSGCGATPELWIKQNNNTIKSIAHQRSYILILKIKTQNMKNDASFNANHLSLSN